jgi:hypothetical protein
MNTKLKTTTFIINTIMDAQVRPTTMMATTTTILIIPVMLDDWIMTVKVIEDCKQQLPRAQ